MKPMAADIYQATGCEEGTPIGGLGDDLVRGAEHGQGDQDAEQPERDAP